MSLNPKNQESQNKEVPFHNALNFISAGVACYAFSLIDELGLLEQLINEEGLSPDCFELYSNPLVIRTAINTLKCNNIILFDQSVFRLTSLGENLVEHRSSIGLIYNGYGKVLASQIKITKEQLFNNNYVKDLINDKAISRASSHLGNTFFNAKLLEILQKHSIHGTICDLGCGDASTLISLCREKKLAGLGFDFSESSIEDAKKNLFYNEDVVLLTKDICNINEIYEDVEVLISSFVMHDFSDILCKKMFKSFKIFFPNAKIFVYIDAVSPENGHHSQLPGFDYVHSLLGIKPRTFEETSTLLTESGFQILNQEAIIGLTNCYIWTLSLS